MKTILSTNKNRDDWIKKACEGKCNIEIKCGDTKFVIQNQMLIKINPKGVYCWTGKQWFCTGELHG